MFLFDDFCWRLGLGYFPPCLQIWGDFLAPFWIPLALWGRPWAKISRHFSLVGPQEGALGTSLGAFGGS